MNDVTDNGGEDDGDSEPEIADEISVSEEKREEDRSRVTFEWCEVVRDVGETYRETGDIEEVADQFNIDLEDAREAAIVYRLIFKDSPEDISFGAYTTAIDFFDGDHSINSLTRGGGSEGVEQSKQYLREFVGAIYRVHNVEKEDNIGEIPNEMDLDPLELDFDSLSPALSAFENIGPLFSDQVINEAFADTRALASAISTMSYQKELQNIAIAVNTLPSVAEQLKIPNDTFVEIAEVFNSVDTLEASLTDVPEVHQFGEIDQADRPVKEQEEIVEELPDDFDELEEKNVEDIEPEDAVKYSIKVVGGSLSRPKSREWYLSVGSRTQTTIVRALLFSAVLAFTGGNIVVASAVAMVLGPGLADMLNSQLETESEE